MLNCFRAIFGRALILISGVMVCAQLAEATTIVTPGSNSGLNQFVYGGLWVFK